MPPNPPSSSMLRILGSVLRTPLPKRLVPELAPPFINARSAPESDSSVLPQGLSMIIIPATH